MKARTPRFEHSLAVAAPADRVLRAFFDHVALASWWQVKRSVTAPRPLGVYAVEWEPTDFRDEVLGPLGGVFHGTVIDFDASAGFFVGGAYWLPPEGDPIGPMALKVSCTLEQEMVRLHVEQSGYEESLRWSRYYAVISSGWRMALASLKKHVERDPAGSAAPSGPP
jgi:hypothetical protein